MKLLTKSNIYHFAYSIVVFLVGGVIFYFIINNVIKEEISEILESELDKIVIDLETTGETPKSIQTVEFELERVNEFQQVKLFSDTLIVEGHSPEEFVPYMQLTTYKIIQNQPYRVVLRESLIEKEGIAYGVIISTIILFVIMLVGLTLINIFISKKVWKPFYQNLALLKNYNVINSTPISAVESDITEFKELSNTIVKMTDKIREDYLSLKEFTENASHEIQSPISIIKSNVDLLLQEDKLSESDHEKVNQINNASNRITKTNQALLLLAKISNEQFQDLEQIDLGESIELALLDFEEFIEARKISVSFNNSGIRMLLMNPTLTKVLLNNIISNSVKHNLEGGFIKIDLNQGIFKISNSGSPLKNTPSKLFDRFVKENQAAESSGLGLSIVKRIAELNNIRLKYFYQDGEHSLEFDFRQIGHQDTTH